MSFSSFASCVRRPSRSKTVLDVVQAAVEVVNAGSQLVEHGSGSWFGDANPEDSTGAPAPRENQKDRKAPQSGHSQVTLLQVIPQAFSAKQSSQIWKPQGHVQQKAGVRSQIVQRYSGTRFSRQRFRRGGGGRSSMDAESIRDGC
jgi:hypothetical protein